VEKEILEERRRERPIRRSRRSGGRKFARRTEGINKIGNKNLFLINRNDKEGI